MLMTLSDDNDVHLIHAYLDGELDVTAALTVERKIASDPDLRKLADEVGALKKVLAEKFPPEPLPPRLRSRLEATFGLQTRQRNAQLGQDGSLDLGRSCPVKHLDGNRTPRDRAAGYRRSRTLRRPSPLANGSTAHRCRFLGQAHRQALVQRSDHGIANGR